MDGLRTCLPCSFEDPLLIQIAVGRKAGPDPIRLIGIGHMRRASVGIRVDGDRADPELAQRPEDANRDLAPVRDEHFAKSGHCPSILARVVARLWLAPVGKTMFAPRVPFFTERLGLRAAEIGAQPEERERGNLPFSREAPSTHRPEIGR